MIITSDNDIRDLLLSIHRVAIVGVSANPSRPSYGVAEYLRDHTDWIIWYVNPNATEVLGQHTFRSLADLPGQPDLVDVFRAPEALDEVTDQAIGISADALWFQLGLVNDQAATRASDAGLTVVQDHCLKVEYERLVRHA